MMRTIERLLARSGAVCLLRGFHEWEPVLVYIQDGVVFGLDVYQSENRKVCITCGKDGGRLRKFEYPS